jgi:hypothetical protein
MKQATGIGMVSAVGAVSYFLDLGFQIPPGGDGLHYFATFGAIGGFGIGGVFAKRIASVSLGLLGFIIFLILFFGSAAALAYMLLISVGASPGPWLIVYLSMLLTLTFFCLGALLPLAGISFSAVH